MMSSTVISYALHDTFSCQLTCTIYYHHRQIWRMAFKSVVAGVPKFRALAKVNMRLDKTRNIYYDPICKELSEEILKSTTFCTVWRKCFDDSRNYFLFFVPLLIWSTKEFAVCSYAPAQYWWRKIEENEKETTYTGTYGKHGWLTKDEQNKYVMLGIFVVFESALNERQLNYKFPLVL